MRNPIKISPVKVRRRIIGYDATLGGFHVTEATKDAAAAELLRVVDRASRKSSTPEFVTVGEYTACIWFDVTSSTYTYGIVAGPDRDGISVGGTSGSAEFADYSATRASVISHLASLQTENLDTLTVSGNGGKTVEESLRPCFPAKWENLETLRGYHAAQLQTA